VSCRRFDSADDEYLVVWIGTQAKGPSATEYEVFGQRLSAAGVEVGVHDDR
jgi:hypothetical protein